MSRALIGLGSNLGDRERFLRTAVDAIGRIPDTSVVRISSVYESPADGEPAAPDYLNAAALLDTTLPPRRLLWHLLLIESRLGRERKRRFGPRPIDLDLLFYDARLIDEADLTVPHPRVLDRSFVLVPLAEIAPGFLHPGAGRPVRELSRERPGPDLRRAGRL